MPGRGRPTFSRMTWLGLTVVDWIFVAFVFGGLAGGVRRGLSGELARVLIAAGCIAAVIFLTRPLADALMARFEWAPRLCFLSALLILLVGAYAILTIIRLALSAMFSFSFKGRTERIGGALCGLVRSGAVAILILLLLSLMPNDTMQAMITQESRIGRLVTARLHPLYEQLSEKVPELRVAPPEATADPSIDPYVEDLPPVDEPPAAPDGDWDAAPLGPVE